MYLIRYIQDTSIVFTDIILFFFPVNVFVFIEFTSAHIVYFCLPECHLLASDIFYYSFLSLTHLIPGILINPLKCKGLTMKNNNRMKETEKTVLKWKENNSTIQED